MFYNFYGYFNFTSSILIYSYFILRYLFVVFSAFALFSIAIALLSLLGLALFAKPKVVMNTVPAMLPHIIVMGIVYLQNRLLYGMCVN